MTVTKALYLDFGAVLLKLQFTQGRMIVGPATQRPVILAFALSDWQVIDACDAQTHQPVLIELPVLVAITAKPTATIIVPFVGEANRDSVLTKRPNLLDQAVVELAIPLARKKGFDFCPTLNEFGPIAPATVNRVRDRYPSGFSRVPCIFGHSGLSRGALGGERGQRWAVHITAPLVPLCKRVSKRI